MQTLLDRERFADADQVVRALQPAYPVYCLRPHVIDRATRHFLAQMPGDALYAVKCNPHPGVLAAVQGAGVHAFDAASLPEVALVAGRSRGNEACYMNPVKAPGSIATAARDYGVRVFAADHAEEVAKIAAEVPEPAATTVAVRIATAGTEAEMDLSGKFGTSPDEAARLMRLVVDRGMRAGIAFHVGSQCCAPAAYTRALAQVGRVIAEAGVRPACVDIGGGFPAPYGRTPPQLSAFADAVRAGLAELDLPAGCRVMSEPGRAVVAQGMSLVVQVHLRAGRRLYINDGVFGSLGEVSIVGLRPPARLVRPTGPSPGAATEVYDLAGPTCDSVDMIPAAVELPAEIATGDWIEIDCMGAYSNALASRFNGFEPGTFVEVDDPPPCS